MKRLATLCLIAALGACAGSPAPPVAHPVAPPAPIADPVAFPLRVIRGVPFVEVRVDDGPPLWFALDTGSPMSVFDRALAERLHKRDAKVEMTVSGTTEGSFAAEMYRVDGLRLGDAKLDNVLAIVADVSAIGDRIGIPFGGILGFGAFEDQLLTIDYPAARGTVQHGELPPPDGDSVLPFTLHARHPSVTLAIGGVPTVVELDTGSGYFMELASAILPRLKLRAPLVVIGQAIGMTGIADVTAARLDATIALGGHPIVDPVVFESPDPSLEADGVARLGGPCLQSFALTFDQRLRRVRFARAGRAPLHARPVRTSGVQLVRKLSAWTVVGFIKGTAGQAAGLQAGDEVVSLDGAAAGALDAGQISEHDTLPGPRHLVVARGGKRVEVDVPSVELVR